MRRAIGHVVRAAVCCVVTLAVCSGGSARAATLNSGTFTSGAGTLTLISTVPGFPFSGKLYTSAIIHTDNHRTHDLTLDVESDYLPHVLQAQEDQLGIDLNPEALKALAIADRSLLYFSLDNKGWIGNGGTAPTFQKSIEPNSSVLNAVAATSTQFLQVGRDAVAGLTLDGTRPANFADEKRSATPDVLQISSADFLADHGWNRLQILHQAYGTTSQLTVGSHFYLNGGSGGAESSTGTLIVGAVQGRPRMLGPRMILSDFEHDPGMLQSVGHKNKSSRFVVFDGQTNGARSTTTANSGRASDLLNIHYDKSAAQGSPFLYRVATGVGDDVGTLTGNLMGFAPAQIGLYLNTQTPGLRVRIRIDADSVLNKSGSKAVIADGQWHKYVWNVDGWSGDMPFTLDSIYLSGISDASISIDDLFYRQTGVTGASPAWYLPPGPAHIFSAATIAPASVAPLLPELHQDFGIASVMVPEPGSISLLAIGVMMLLRRRS